MSEAPAMFAGSGRWRRAALLVLLFVLVGPPVGGLVVIAIGNVMDYARGNGPPHAMLQLLPMSYVPGILPALASGIFAAVLHTESRSRWLVANTLFGAAAGLGGCFLFLLALAPLASQTPLMLVVLFVAPGGVAAFACALLAERIGWRHGG